MVTKSGWIASVTALVMAVSIETGNPKCDGREYTERQQYPC